MKQFKKPQAVNWMCYSEVNETVQDESDILVIKKYIKDVINLQSDKTCIRLPSIEAVKDFFSVNAQTVIDCLRELRQEGYHFMVVNQTQPVLVWDVLALEALPQR